MNPRRRLPALALFLAVAAFATPSAHAEEAAPQSGPTTVRIKPLMLPVVNASGTVERYNQLEVALELRDAGKLAEVQAAQPRVHDAILGELYKAVSAGQIQRGNIVNTTGVRKRLADVCDTILGKGVIDRVLLTPVARQSSLP